MIERGAEAMVSSGIGRETGYCAFCVGSESESNGVETGREKASEARDSG